MAANVQKIDSNVTELAYAEELTIGVLPVTPTWIKTEPNSYSDFGATYTKIARNPINRSRQRKKGVLTDLDASGGIQQDLTHDNFQDLLQGVLFADSRRKTELLVTGVASDGEYTVAAGGASYLVGDLVAAKNFPRPRNNGLKVVTAGSDATGVNVTAASLEVAGAQIGVISKCGYQFTAGDIEIDVTGSFPRLLSTAKNFEDLGVIEGEWIFIGGDLAIHQFAEIENRGWARIRSIDINEIQLDKTQFEMVADDGAAKTVRIFFGKVIKNETGALIKRRSYQLERRMGVPDTTQPDDEQAQYLPGSVANEFTMTINTADKITCDISFISMRAENVEADVGLKTGNRPALIEGEAFNTSTNVKRIKLSRMESSGSFPNPLFAFVSDISISINNNVTPNKAVGVLGAFDMTAGTFEVSGAMTAYFSDIAAIKAIEENQDISLDFQLVLDNKGVVLDLPLVTLGDGTPNVAQDEPITLPLSMDAATAAKIDPNLDYTAMFCFFDYLPDLAG